MCSDIAVLVLAAGPKSELGRKEDRRNSGFQSPNQRDRADLVKRGLNSRISSFGLLSALGDGAAGLFPAGLFSTASGLFLALLLCGCTGLPHEPPPAARRFNFEKDTFAFPNELLWTYNYDANGHWRIEKRRPKPDYTLHCFVLARSACQFFQNARFAPDQSLATDARYRRLVHEVLSGSPNRALPARSRVVIPGYPDLRAFSVAHEKLLKQECGSAFQSYFQRGNWRMVFPFSRRGQAALATRLMRSDLSAQPQILHLARFPRLSINHAVVAFGAEPGTEETRFRIYDPNQPRQPGVLIYKSSGREFSLPHNSYFRGGRVNAYRVYYKWDY